MHRYRGDADHFVRHRTRRAHHSPGSVGARPVEDARVRAHRRRATQRDGTMTRGRASGIRRPRRSAPEPAPPAIRHGPSRRREARPRAGPRRPAAGWMAGPARPPADPAPQRPEGGPSTTGRARRRTRLPGGTTASDADTVRAGCAGSSGQGMRAHGPRVTVDHVGLSGRSALDRSADDTPRSPKSPTGMVPGARAEVVPPLNRQPPSGPSGAR